MDPTQDTFLALARSSPWRWSTLHFTHRADTGQVEAWVRRPGQLLVVTSDGERHRVSGVPYAVSPPVPDPKPPQAAAPVLRPDGLVATRPADPEIEYDDPMWVNFSWVAMLDPVELSHHVEIADLRPDEVCGRPVWRAHLRPVPGYAARCGGNCCELLWSDVSRIMECSDPADAPPARPGTVYPDGYDVALDVQTGVVVRCLPVGEHSGAPWLEVDIHEVDADLDHLFD